MRCISRQTRNAMHQQADPQCDASAGRPTKRCISMQIHNAMYYQSVGGPAMYSVFAGTPYDGIYVPVGK